MRPRSCKFMRKQAEKWRQKVIARLSQEKKSPLSIRRKPSTSTPIRGSRKVAKKREDSLLSNNVLASVTCSICRMFYRDPFMLLPCEHSFCNPCISIWLMKNFSCPLCRGVPSSFRQNSDCAMEVFKLKMRRKFNPHQCSHSIFQESNLAGDSSPQNYLLREPSMTREQFMELPLVKKKRTANRDSVMQEFWLRTSQLSSRLEDVATNLYGIINEVERVTAEIDGLNTRISMHISELNERRNNQNTSGQSTPSYLSSLSEEEAANEMREMFGNQ